ncbi:hypothetical protein V8G54_010655 [Vigna mungo]|uniref:BHLH domain-containing protein n=1 Tax=Vigna mungo TaxID=3915 RepID=A0AAQ3S5Z6_VIGMU
MAPRWLLKCFRLGLRPLTQSIPSCSEDWMGFLMILLYQNCVARSLFSLSKLRGRVPAKSTPMFKSRFIFLMAPAAYFNWDTLQIPTSETTFHEKNLSFENYIDPPLYDPSIFIAHSNIFPTSQEDTLLLSPQRQKYCCESEVQKLTAQTALPFSLYTDQSVVPYDNFYSSHIKKLPQQISGEFAQLDSTCECVKKGKERTISPQSLAARERRRKISEKTQQLGKLVPGRPNMNTTEMLHAAAKYVKYLQAQVKMLDLTKLLQWREMEERKSILYATAEESGGPSYAVELGRLDRRVSAKGSVRHHIPHPDF